MSFVRKYVSEGATGFGDDLRGMRELRGYSREYLGRVSGIHPEIIAAFEEERIEDLSDPIYAERHIRALAKILETRADFFLDKYHALCAQKGVCGEGSKQIRTMARRRDFFVLSRAFLFGGFLCLAALLAGYVVWQALLVSHAPLLLVDAPSEGQVVTSSHVEVHGTTDPTALVTVNGVHAIVREGGDFVQAIDVPVGVSTVRVESRRRYSSANVIERHVIYERSP